MSDGQIREIREYLQEFPSKCEALRDTPAKAARWRQIAKRIARDVKRFKEKGPKHVLPYMVFAQQSYTLSSVDAEPLFSIELESHDEKVLATYYGVGNIAAMLDDLELVA